VNAPFVLDVKGGEKEEKLEEYTTKGEKKKENQRSILSGGKKERKRSQATH
jgi:hypothetical protein